MLNAPPPPPAPVQPVYNYSGYGGYPPYQQPVMYGGQYPQQPVYGNYMGQPNPYMTGSYAPQPMYQTGQNPPGYGGGYMAKTNTGYMNQTYAAQNQPFNPYNTYKK